jgi:hypothetical protein
MDTPVPSYNMDFCRLAKPAGNRQLEAADRWAAPSAQALTVPAWTAAICPDPSGCDIFPAPMLLPVD